MIIETALLAVALAAEPARYRSRRRYYRAVRRVALPAPQLTTDRTGTVVVLKTVVTTGVDTFLSRWDALRN